VLHLGGAGTDRCDGARTALDDVPGLRGWAAAEPGRPAVVVADDVPGLPDATADALAALARPGGPLLVLAAGAAPELAGAFRGPAVPLRRSRTALLLRPGAGDGQLLGLRLPRAPLPARPGSGWLVVAGTATRVQVARRRVPPSADPVPGPAAARPVAR
jgi:S-DNA-T family DNA segregation ATPase FtsK/SpoIIIE